MKPDPEPWYNTSLNLWQIAAVLVAGWSLAKTLAAGWRRSIGLRWHLTTRLRKIAPGVRHDYVESLLGEPKWQSTTVCTRFAADADEAGDRDRKVELTVRTWPLSRLGYLVTWSEDDVMVMYGITTISWWFRPSVRIGGTRIRLGKTSFAILDDTDEHRARLGNRRFGYMESHYFGNPGGYRSWYVGVNDIGYNAVPLSLDWFDEEDTSRTRLLPEMRAAYRASAPINTVVVSGIASYEEVEDGSFFGTSLGVDQDLVRLADPEFHVLDSRVSRVHQRLRERRWRWYHRRWEKRQKAAPQGP
ncbi:ETEC_3214 domain-containing protein [Streptomyces sp. NPDC057099]|uniref:ETEC_3214 domain-containing protein n=1 Tax=Streptomyces sp. NPDC057099 TaxID=3346019 RepID=UPI00363FF5D9